MTTMIDTVRHAVVITGAGFSAPSGLPVYRKSGTGWLDEEGARLSRAEHYSKHLADLWPRWHALARRVTAAHPNVAHRALARWEQLLCSRGGSMTIVTQNIDGLHQKAGSTRVLEAHGTILRARLLTEGSPLFDYTPAGSDNMAVPPAAPCGSVRTRPDIVLFGEQPRHMDEAVAALQRADLALFAGTSGRVWPVAGLLDIAREFHVPTMLWNQEEWGHGRFDVTVLEDVIALDELIPHTTT